MCAQKSQAKNPAENMFAYICQDKLSKDFFGKALASYHKERPDAIAIDDLNLSAASAAGQDNYTSEIYRAVVAYHSDQLRDQSISLIIKVMPVTERSAPIVDELAVFDKEVHMYTDTLPRLSKLLGGKKLSANYIYSEREPLQIIVFEDLAATGYRMADRKSGIDEDHCFLVLDTMGKFHASSMVLAKEDPNAMALYWYGILKPDGKRGPRINAFLNNGLAKVIEHITKAAGSSEETIQRLKSLQSHYIATLEYHSNHTPCDYKVLNHGDAWTNNYLFKYDPSSGRPVDLIFIDYQLSYYSSPGIDLNYFLNLSPNIEIREHKRDDLIRAYYVSFTNTFDTLDHSSNSSEEFSLERVTKEIQSRELYGFMTTASFFPIISKAPTATTEEEIYNNPLYVQSLKGAVKRLEDLRVLEKLG